MRACFKRQIILIIIHLAKKNLSMELILNILPRFGIIYYDQGYISLSVEILPLYASEYVAESLISIFCLSG